MRLAAAELHSTPAIIVDFGTATTFDAVSGERELLGSAIAPGLVTAMEGWFSAPHGLFAVELTPPSHARLAPTPLPVSNRAPSLATSAWSRGWSSDSEKRCQGRRVPSPREAWRRSSRRTLRIFDLVDLDLTLHGLRLYYGSEPALNLSPSFHPSTSAVQKGAERMTQARTQILGYPRIGEKRELKQADRGVLEGPALAGTARGDRTRATRHQLAEAEGRGDRPHSL